jgi:hypothetical protein
MIVFELSCEKQHRFEGWFASGDAFDQQSMRGQLCCPVCSSSQVNKLPSSKIKRAEQVRVPQPKSESETNVQTAMPNAEQRAQLMALVDQILQNTENVGPKFADEARKIFHKEAPERAIRGVATADETRELIEEGVPVLPLPVPPQNEWH